MPNKNKVFAGLAVLSVMASVGMAGFKESPSLSKDSIQSLEALNKNHQMELFAMSDLSRSLEKDLLSAQLLESDYNWEKTGLMATTEDRAIFLLEPEKEMTPEELKQVAREYSSQIPEFENVEVDQKLELNQASSTSSVQINPSQTTTTTTTNVTSENTDETQTVRVAVFDSGVDRTHPIFENTVVTEGWNTIDNQAGAPDEIGHGTHVAGIVASEEAGLEIHPYKIIAPGSGGRLSNVVAGLTHLLDEDDVDIVNMSFGFPEGSPTLEKMIEEATAEGIIFVAASGNRKDGAAFYPAYYDSVVAVGSATRQLGTLSSSNYGEWVDVAGLGHLIQSALPNGGYGYKSGTSQATAYVSAYVADVLNEKKPELKEDRLQVVMDSLQQVPKKVRSGNLQGLSLID